MPISGLTDRDLAFPEIGHIRKGDLVTRKRSDGSEYKVPIDLEYFRVTFDKGEQEAEDIFRNLYGEQPQEINIMLPFDDIERQWDPYLEAYTAGRMIARSDGEFLVSRVNYETGEWDVLNGIDAEGHKVPHPPDNIAGYDYKKQPIEFEPVGRLKVILPELKRAAYLTVHTTSYNDIISITNQLRAVKYMFGRLSGIPLVLKRRPQMISTPKGKDSKDRVRREKWMLSIEADPQFVALKIEETKRLALPNGEGLPDYAAMATRLPPPRKNDPDNVPAEESELEELEQDELDEEEIIEGDAVLVRHPDAVRNLIIEKGAKYGKGSAGDTQRKVLAQTLNTLFDGDEDNRYTACKFLFGVASTKDMSDGVVKAALVDWLQVTDFNQPPSKQAIQEAKTILAYALEQSGQMAMDLSGLEEGG